METSSDGDRPWQSFSTVYTTTKAGMDGVDKEKVQKIVYEMSKGSKYFENEQRKETIMKQKIESMRVRCAKLTEKDIAQFQKIAERRILELEAERDLSKFWLHVDMDAFYAAVETLENPELKGKMLAVGSMSMICTASYEARKFGVRAAMPGFIARKLCPQLIFVPTNFEKYTYYSKLTRKVFQEYDPFFIATSLDEAYLNITDVCMKRGISGVEVADELRAAIHEQTGLTCSAGVAPNRMLAKVCSDINKPNGQFILPNNQGAVMAFVSSLPIRKIGGIGKVTEHVLKDVLGISSCDEMLQKRALICALFSRCSSDFFLSVGLGIGGSDSPEFKSRKSMSSERTFSATDNAQLLFQKLSEVAESLSKDMQKESLYGRTLTLKLKTSSFEVRTRAISMSKHVQSEEDILNNAIKLLKAELPLSLRLIGLRISHFQDDNHAPDPTQRTLRNFVISGNPSATITCNDNFSYSEENDVKPMDNSKCNHSSLESLDEPSISRVTYDNCSADCSDGFNTLEVVQSSPCGTSSAEVEICHGKETSEIVHAIQELEPNSGPSLVGRREVPSNKHQLVWINDYICSICGIELPPSFIPERQEHCDYHMAKMLQEEENKISSSNTRRITQRMKINKEFSNKKHKSSPKNSKYLPIDSFFVNISKK